MISLVVPCYPMQGRGAEFLSELLESIRRQTYTDWEVVVSDDGRTNADVCFKSRIKGMVYVPGVAGAPANLNHAIKMAAGKIIKPMFQDDKFIEPDSLRKIVDAFNGGAEWVACNSQNGGEPGMRDDLFKPYPHNSVFRLSEGENTYGSPSAMAWKRDEVYGRTADLKFDENLHWLFDCEFYGRMAERYGVPVFVDTPIFIRQWSGMATLTVADGAQRVADRNYVIEKFRAQGMAV